jgi:hypothetical protein
VHEEYGGSVVAHEPTPGELELAAAAVAVVRAEVDPEHAPLLYARVDCVAGTDGAALLMELELIEPSLFLPFAPPAEVERLLRAVLAR